MHHGLTRNSKHVHSVTELLFPTCQHVRDTKFYRLKTLKTKFHHALRLGINIDLDYEKSQIVRVVPRRTEFDLFPIKSLLTNIINDGIYLLTAFLDLKEGI